MKREKKTTKPELEMKMVKRQFAVKVGKKIEIRELLMNATHAHLEA